MPLEDILEYLNHPIDETNFRLSESYGTENFVFFLYSLLLMQQPNVVVELGTGAGTTSIMAAEALRRNGRGHIWTVDDGSDWRQEGPLRRSCQHALGYEDQNETYCAFMQRLLRTFGLENYLSLVEMRLEEEHFFRPKSGKIDVLFADATGSGPKLCASLLRYYLPKMETYSSICVSSA